MEIVHVYTPLRSEFGRYCILSDYGPELTLDLLPDPGLSAQFLLRSPRDMATQARHDMSEHQVPSRVQGLINMMGYSNYLWKNWSFRALSK